MMRLGEEEMLLEKGRGQIQEGWKAKRESQGAVQPKNTFARAVSDWAKEDTEEEAKGSAD